MLPLKFVFEEQSSFQGSLFFFGFLDCTLRPEVEGKA